MAFEQILAARRALRDGSRIVKAQISLAHLFFQLLLRQHRIDFPNAPQGHAVQLVVRTTPASGVADPPRK